MKKILLALLCALSLNACGDGDLEIETIDFSTGNPQNCGTLTTDTRIFFKLNGDEALILELPAGLLKNEVSNGAISSEIPAKSKVTYRLFSDKATKEYFCNDIPPISPSVKNTIEAEGGTVLVTTTLAEDGVSYNHQIELQGLSLLKQDGSRITDLSVSNFGTITTKPTTSFNASNLDFTADPIQFCGETVSTDTRLLFKTHDNRSLIVSLADGLLQNQVSTDTLLSPIADGSSEVTYRVFSSNVTSAYFCSNIPPANPKVNQEYRANGGQIRVFTSLAEDGVSYVHNVQLDSLSFVREDQVPVVDPAIQNFGDITTAP